MARLNPRGLAAGLGVVAAFLLLGGPTSAAIADPGGGHSDRDSSWDRGGGDGRGGSGHDDDGGYGGSRRGANDGSVSGKTGSNDSPQVRVGSGRDDVEELTPSNGIRLQSIRLDGPLRLRSTRAPPTRASIHRV